MNCPTVRLGFAAWIGVFIIAFAANPWGVFADPGSLADQRVSVRLMEGQKLIGLRAAAPLSVRGGKTDPELPAGTYTIHLSNAKPARQRFHLFAKSFQPGEDAAERAYIAEWKAKGRDAEAVVIGRRLQTESGIVLDSRVHWISVARFESEEAAKAGKAKLEREGQWTWMNAETVAPGTGRIEVKDAKGKVVAALDAPAAIQSAAPVRLSNVDTGFWKEDKKQLEYAGLLEVGIDPKARLMLVESLPVETYLEGVLPAEMPASWPVGALKAQAVAARSEVLASLGTKHALEGFEFCGSEHCRAYLGASGLRDTTSAAVRETAGEILVRDGKIVPTVFSSNCGGWTESNETVWRSPANPALRAVSDLAGGNEKSPIGRGMSAWLTQPPKANCSGDPEGFRWRRKYTAGELSAIVNKRHAVGTISKIDLGERGEGGRLKSVTIRGAKQTVTVEKELPIRSAFGGLPSAMFVLERSGSTYTFTGGGRGHGVGLCQYGARGMAGRGIVYTRIVLHYFTGARLERYR